MVFGMSGLWSSIMRRTEMNELEITPAPNVDGLVAEIKFLKERVMSAEKQQQHLERAHQTREKQVRLFADKKKKAEEAADELRVTLVEAERQYELSQKARLCADEKCRRLSELLQTAEQTATATRKENKILTYSIATLQTGIEILTDDQVKDQMTTLYHELGQWIFSHIADPECDNQRFMEMQSTICGWIYQTFWSSFFVGFGPSSSRDMMSLDNVVKKNCPTHIAQHWRYGTSFCGFKLREQDLDTQCDFIVYQIGCLLSSHVSKTREWRMDQLKSLIWRGIELKHKLEYQEGSYMFWTSTPGVAFRSDMMCDFAQDSSPGQVIQYSLWPGIFKAIKSEELEVVVNEIVHTIPPSNQRETTANQMSWQTPNEAPDSI